MPARSTGMGGSAGRAAAFCGARQVDTLEAPQGQASMMPAKSPFEVVAPAFSYLGPVTMAPVVVCRTVWDVLGGHIATCHAELAAMARQMGIPWNFAGDGHVRPGDFVGSARLCHVGGEVVTPQGAARSCMAGTSTPFDHAVMRRDFTSPVHRCELVPDMPRQPHARMHLILGAPAGNISVRKLLASNPLELPALPQCAHIALDAPRTHCVWQACLCLLAVTGLRGCRSVTKLSIGHLASADEAQDAGPRYGALGCITEQYLTGQFGDAEELPAQARHLLRADGQQSDSMRWSASTSAPCTLWMGWRSWQLRRLWRCRQASQIHEGENPHHFSPRNEVVSLDCSGLLHSATFLSVPNATHGFGHLHFWGQWIRATLHAPSLDWPWLGGRRSRRRGGWFGAAFHFTGHSHSLLSPRLSRQPLRSLSFPCWMAITCTRACLRPAVTIPSTGCFGVFSGIPGDIQLTLITRVSCRCANSRLSNLIPWSSGMQKLAGANPYRRWCRCSHGCLRPFLHGLAAPNASFRGIGQMRSKAASCCRQRYPKVAHLGAIQRGSAVKDFMVAHKFSFACSVLLVILYALMRGEAPVRGAPRQVPWVFCGGCPSRLDATDARFWEANTVADFVAVVKFRVIAWQPHTVINGLHRCTQIHVRPFGLRNFMLRPLFRVPSVFRGLGR